jgi:hypothetical protein
MSKTVSSDIHETFRVEVPEKEQEDLKKIISDLSTML